MDPIQPVLPTKKGELIEQFTTTFGIEIEFCTHNSNALSYTHIEVCLILDDESEWKIETDSGYTLELVSPILIFTASENNAHQQANECKQMLVKALYKIAKSSQPLEACITEIRKTIVTLRQNFKFKYLNLNEKQEEQSEDYILEGGIKYISQSKLIAELNEHNWDDTAKDVDFEIEKKKIKAKAPETHLSDLKQVKISPSQKYTGQIPSSQLNLPMSLKAYVWYLAYVKEPTAWRRLLLLSDNAFIQEWKGKRSNKIRGITGTVVPKKLLSKASEEKVKDWFKYWFWLVSIRELTEVALQQVCNYEDKCSWRTKLSSIKKNPQATLQKINFKSFESETKISNQAPYIGLPKDIEIGTSLPIHHYWVNTKEETTESKEETTESVASSLLYLIVHKLIAGTLGVLSEGVQLQIQKIIVQKKLSSQEAIKEVSQATSTKFCDYHSFLKDLTPLWFKGSLCDVLMVSLNSFKEDDINVICQNLISGINVLNEVNVKKIMEENFSFLKIIYNSQKTIKLDFNKFLLELIPDMNEFIRQYELGRKELIDLLKLIQTQRNVWYLGQYTYMGSKANQNNFLDRKNVPPWEGRWDTLKPPIEEGEKTEFLVEHRNN